MARTRGPLFGAGAAGGLGRAISYSRVPTGGVAKRSPRKNAAPTYKERNARAAMQFLQRGWTLDVIPIVGPDNWNAIGRKENLPGYNAYLKATLKQVLGGTGPRIDISYVPPGVQPVIASITYPLTTHIPIFTANVTAYNDAWGTFIYLLETPFQLPAWNRIVTTIDYQSALFTPEQSFPVYGLKPGTNWYVYYRSFTLAGDLEQTAHSAGTILID